jgi:hypothetical protein
MAPALNDSVRFHEVERVSDLEPISEKPSYIIFIKSLLNPAYDFCLWNSIADTKPSFQWTPKKEGQKSRTSVIHFWTRGKYIKKSEDMEHCSVKLLGKDFCLWLMEVKVFAKYLMV